MDWLINTYLLEYLGHHQCINALGKDVVVTATAQDGIVEAIEIKDRENFIGVQWHPEIMFNNKEMTQLFSWLCSKA